MDDHELRLTVCCLSTSPWPRLDVYVLSVGEHPTKAKEEEKWITDTLIPASLGLP
jgi:hypothetical protein